MNVGDFVDFWSRGEHLFARVQEVKASEVTGTKVTVEAFLSLGRDKGVEDLRIRTLTRPMEDLLWNDPTRKGEWTWGLTLRELYEIASNR